MKFLIISLVIFSFLFISCTKKDELINNDYKIELALTEDLKLNISWDSLSLSNEIKTYEVYKSTNKDADYVKIATVNKDETLKNYSYLDDFILDGSKTYYYKVRAITIISNEEFSKTVSYKAITDIDNDGFVEDDCAANLELINPGAEETCDNKDNNCNNQIDENVEDIVVGTDIGECQKGITQCINGALVLTQAEIKPSTEFCDSKDNNCNNEVDENSDIQCPNACGEAGVRLCVSGVLLDCNAPLVPAEICNGLDDDCNGIKDDGFLDTDNNNIANCVDDDDDGDGELDITDCEPLNKDNFNGNIEKCDGMDNNCDNVIDEGFIDSDRDGITDCVDPDDDNDGDNDLSDCQPLNKDVFNGQVEFCDNKDNNCNNQIDENLFKECSNLCGNGETICIEGHWLGCDANIVNAEDWTSNAPLKRTRFAKTQNKDNKVFIFSGLLSTGELSNELWSYNTSFKTWEKLKFSGHIAPNPRTYASLTYRKGSEELYLYGGLDSENNILDDFWKFDIETKTWTQISSIGENITELFAASIYSDNFDNIILFAGKSDNSINDKTYRYSISQNKWSIINNAVNPIGRYNHSVTYNSLTNSLFVFGGNTSESDYSNSLWRFNLNTFEWFFEASSISVPGVTRSSIYSKGENIYIFGGDTETVSQTLNIYKYNITERDWDTINLLQDNISSFMVIGDGSDIVSIWGGEYLDLSISNVDIKFDLESQTHFIETNLSGIYKAATSYGITQHKNYLFGGFSEQGFSNDLWEYSQYNNTWEKLYLSNEPEAREAASIAIDENENKLYMYGGNDAISNYGDLWVLDLNAKTSWEKLTINDGPTYRRDAYLFYRRGEIYLFGGYEDGAKIDLYKLNKLESKWEEVIYINTSPELRDKYAVIYSAQNNYLILFGGDKQGVKSNDLWSLDIDTKKWVTYNIGIVKPSQRDSAKFIYDYNIGSVYLLGGIDENNNHLSDFWSLEIGSSNWFMVKGNSSVDNFNQRFGLSSFFVNSSTNHYIYVLGGKNNTNNFYLQNKLNLICE